MHPPIAHTTGTPQWSFAGRHYDARGAAYGCGCGEPNRRGRYPARLQSCPRLFARQTAGVPVAPFPALRAICIVPPHTRPGRAWCRNKGAMKRRRPFWLWLFSLWTLGLGVVSLWRGLVLWQERRLLLGLGSSFSSLPLALFVALWLLCGGGLIVSALGLWLRRAWARHVARIGIVLSVLIFQAYLWLFVRSGLMRQRRPVLLIVGLLTLVTGVATLTWSRARRCLGLDD